MMGANSGTKRNFTLVVFLVACLSVLTGCEGGEGSARIPSVSGSAMQAAPTPTPTPTVYVPASENGPAQNVPVPVMPEAAKQQTKEGWEAFAKYYVEELNYMVETNDPSRIKSLSVEGCDFCRVETKYATILSESGQWTLNGKYSLGKIDALMSPDREGNIGGNLSISRQDSSIVSQKGVLGTAAGVESSVWYLQLQPSDTGWKVFQFGETK